MVEQSMIWGTPEEIEEEMDDLRRNHPEWNERLFLHWAAEIYLRIDHARRTGALDVIQSYCSEKCFAAVSKILKKSKAKLKKKPLELQGVQIAHVGEEGIDDYIDVRLIAQRNKVLLIEYLRFTRPQYEPTKFLTGEAVDRCPHCGARIMAFDEWECEYCGTVLAEQSVGWTIVAIMKEGEYTG